MLVIFGFITSSSRFLREYHFLVFFLFSLLITLLGSSAIWKLCSIGRSLTDAPVYACDASTESNFSFGNPPHFGRGSFPALFLLFLSLVIVFLMEVGLIIEFEPRIYGFLRKGNNRKKRKYWGMEQVNLIYKV